jgi:hypothetical protein
MLVEVLDQLQVSDRNVGLPTLNLLKVRPWRNPTRP